MTDERELEELAKLLETTVEDENHATVQSMSEDSNSKETNVRISPDNSEAWLYLSKPKDNQSYTKDQLLQLLSQSGVKTGYIMSNITAMAKKGVYERAIKVASKVPCEEGKDGWYEFFFDAEHSDRSHPRIREDGSVDYASMHLLENVEKGKVLAIYHPAIAGKDGYFIDGTPIAPQPVKDLPPLKGTGFSNRKIETEYCAETDGKLEYKNNEIHIRTIHEIPGDVNMITGVVEFYGDILIKGNVETGVVIHAGKTLTIEGTVEAAELYAEGDIILKRGIQGSNRASVTSEHGSVYADFIEHTTVNAAENVESNTILSSEIRAQGKVILTGKKGMVVGGYIHGRNGVSAVNAGNNVEVRTVLHAGLESMDHEKNSELLKRDTVYREKLTSILQEMTSIVNRRKLRELTLTEEKYLATLLADKEKYVKAMKENAVLLEAMRHIVEEASKAEICVYDRLYRGVVISLDNQSTIIENNTCYMSYRNLSGTIIGSVVVRN